SHGGDDKVRRVLLDKLLQRLYINFSYQASFLITALWFQSHNPRTTAFVAARRLASTTSFEFSLSKDLTHPLVYS
ncbi:hypothetical protein EUTSA_v10017680mg, partial [Eutrema salsugineum]